MKRILTAIAILSVTLNVYAQNYGNGLPATDALGRKLADREEAGKTREKFVGLFYWTWHNHFAHFDVCIPSEYIKEAPEAAYDYHHPKWRKDIGYHFWGEPLFGFYRNTDRWVLRKHAEMLAEAGIDVIFFDCTNGSYTWKESYQALCEVFIQARKDGVRTPQIAFMMAFGPTSGSMAAMIDIYEDLYKPGIYKDLFFLWEGKPLIMGYPEAFTLAKDYNQRKVYYDEILNFFTFRPGQPVYNAGPGRPDHWGWLEIYPQHGFGPKKDGGFEQATVGTAQNWTVHNGLSAMNMPGAFGRSYTAEKGHSDNPEDVALGLNFQEQWERAIKLDPDLIFITGWNEWVMGRFETWQNQPNAFPDQFDQEHSRDIEPMRGGHGDNYYYQMVDNIRRFKGMETILMKEQDEVRIRIDGHYEDWASAASYNAYKGNTMHRDSPGWGDIRYTDQSGRNDIIRAKVAHDKKYIYFYVECNDIITPHTDDAWMRLFIDIDRDAKTGWEGYDYMLNRDSPDTKITIERSSDSWEWEKCGDAEFSVDGKCMEIAVPRSSLGLSKKDRIALEFKWADNMKSEGDIYDFYISGDAAPLGRFNYLYMTK